MNDLVFERHELKFLVNDPQRRFLEQAFAARMRPDAHGESTVCSLYFDTPSRRLARRSAEKPLYKEKLRLRSYGPAAPEDAVFLELKKKYRGVVYKRRTELPQREALACLASGAPLPQSSQIAREIDAFARFYGQLLPSMYLCCDRAAFFCAEEPALRITFDNAIRFSPARGDLAGPPDGSALLAPGQSLMEIKTPGAVPLWLTALLGEGAVRQTSFSKYGRAYESLLAANLKETRGATCA